MSASTPAPTCQPPAGELQESREVGAELEEVDGQTDNESDEI